MTNNKTNSIFLDRNVKTSIKDFFNSVSILSKNKIIRSSKYSADIAEFICSKFYDLELCKNQREIGYDALDKNNNKIQIKINNSSQKTNQTIGDKRRYNFLFLVITSKSLLFKHQYKPAFLLIYKIPVSNIVGDKYIAKKLIHSLTPDLILDNNFETIV